MARYYFWLLCCASIALGACSSNNAVPAPSQQSDVRAQHRRASDGDYIKHVVILVQENRSFDNLFATFPNADGATRGKNSDGNWVDLKSEKLYSKLALENSRAAFQVDYDGGKMDGWNLVYVNSVPCPTCAYSYVNPAQIQPYWTMAQQYVLADHMFPSESSGSFSAHQDLIRGDSVLDANDTLVDFPSHGPWGCDAPSGTTTPLLTAQGKYVLNGPFPCFTYETLRDTLDAKGVSWKYYTPELFTGGLAGAYWDAFDAISAVRNGPEWNTNISSPEKTIFNDISGGSLASVSWVIPDGQNSDHSSFAKLDTGPSWVAQVVNAIGQSQYWNSTAIVVVWDDWGGWYDHVPPPQLDYAGLGFRVPMLVVSPYAKAGYVSHTSYEFGSVIKFVEDVYGLSRLGTSDVRAASIDDVFDFTQPPRTFSPIPAKYSKSFFQHQPPSNVPVDTN